MTVRRFVFALLAIFLLGAVVARAQTTDSQAPDPQQQAIAANVAKVVGCMRAHLCKNTLVSPPGTDQSQIVFVEGDVQYKFFLFTAEKSTLTIWITPKGSAQQYTTSLIDRGLDGSLDWAVEHSKDGKEEAFQAQGYGGSTEERGSKFRDDFQKKYQKVMELAVQHLLK